MIAACNVGLIGYGYWGTNLARNFSELDGARLVSIADASPARQSAASKRYRDVRVTSSADELLSDRDIEAVAIATPVNTHFELARRALRSGKHVFVEKPMTSNSKQGLELIEEAERRNLVLMVDHTFVYTGAVRKIRELVAAGHLGDIYYYDSVRINLGLFQSDVNVLWDLAVHDLSIIDSVISSRPTGVAAVAKAHVRGQPENIAYLTLRFPGDLIAHLHVNWLAPVKIRRTLIGGRDRMIVYDDLEPSEKVKVYDKGAHLNLDPETRYQALVSYRDGDLWAPKLDLIEALRTELSHFVECILHQSKPLSDGQAGLRIVRILEAADRSILEGGRIVSVDLSSD